MGRRIRLTAAGELLLPHARRVFRELQEAQSALGELHGLKRGQLKVGIMQTVSACVIPEIVSRFSAAHPGVRVTCTEMPVAEVESGLESGKLDLGISFSSADSRHPGGRTPLHRESCASSPGWSFADAATQHQSQ
jgi:LysR family cyn operon transcriptional activator